MINFDRIIPLAVKSAGDRPILAAIYPLPSVLCRDLHSEGLISGFVAESSQIAVNREPHIAGWWIDRPNGICFLRRGPSKSIIFFGNSDDSAISGRMLLEARLKGYERFLLVGIDGSIVQEINITSALLHRLCSFSSNKDLSQPSYDNAFDEMYSLLDDRLRLPVRAFDPGRVLIFTPNLDAGGAQRQATYTALGLARRWPGKIHVARSRSAGALDDFYKPALDVAGIPTDLVTEDEEYSSVGIQHIRNELASRYFSLGFLDIFYMIFHQALLIQAIRPALVHTFQDYSNILAGIAADLVGVPRLVLSGRSVAPDNFRFFQPYMAPAYHALLRRRKVIFLNNSEAGAADYARWLSIPKDQFRVIHNGFEFPEQQLQMRATLREALGVSESAVLIGSIIGFREEKRPQLFIEMAQVLRASRPNVHFVIFGDGPLLSACREFVETRNLSGFIHLPGLTDNAWGALSAMDIFVLTSRVEGLPNVMIEAQAMGLPVVCTGTGGMYETFIQGETGFGVPIEALTEKVGRLIDDSMLRARMGAAAMRHARENFSINRMIDRTIDAYASAPRHKSDEIIPDWHSVDSFDEIRIGGAIKDEGHCFVATLPEGLDASNLCLWEDDHRLGPLSDHGDIRTVGAGRYIIQTKQILFSSSDCSDVRFNGRAYRLRSQNTEPDFVEISIFPESTTPEIGYCYIAHLGLDVGSKRASLWEDGTRLGPGGCLHDQIRTEGMGCYSVWGPDLYFSTFDNSDPRKNGRTYHLRIARRLPALADKSRIWAGAPIDRAFRHMLARAVPRDDFVPGRIVHVIGSLGPGGAERQTVYTLTGLSKHSFESVQLLCYYLAASGADRHDFYLPAFTAAGIPVRTVRRHAADDDLAGMPFSLRCVCEALPPGLAADIADLFWEFVNLRPEIVHAWLDGLNIRAAFAAALAGVPRIVISGRNVNPSNFDYLYEPCMAPAYRALLELPQIKMVNNSFGGRDDYARWLQISADKIAVIYNGCEYPTAFSESTRRHARQIYNISHDAVVVGTVTRLSEEKRPALFIEMAHRALEKQHNLRFIFFGIGPLRDELQALIERLGLSDAVTLMGITNDIWTSLAAMDVFVLTSRQEGLPNVLIEAQCAGLPVISTKVGGAPETFLEGKTGFGVDVSSPENLAETLLRLTLNPDRRLEMSVAATAFARKEFSVEQMIAHTLDLYTH